MVFCLFLFFVLLSFTVETEAAFISGFHQSPPTRKRSCCCFKERARCKLLKVEGLKMYKIFGKLLNDIIQKAMKKI